MKNITAVSNSDDDWINVTNENVITLPPGNKIVRPEVINDALQNNYIYLEETKKNAIENKENKEISQPFENDNKNIKKVSFVFSRKIKKHGLTIIEFCPESKYSLSSISILFTQSQNVLIQIACNPSNRNNVYEYFKKAHIIKDLPTSGPLCLANPLLIKKFYNIFSRQITFPAEYSCLWDSIIDMKNYATSEKIASQNASQDMWAFVEEPSETKYRWTTLKDPIDNVQILE